MSLKHGQCEYILCFQVHTVFQCKYVLLTSREVALELQGDSDQMSELDIVPKQQEQSWE